MYNGSITDVGGLLVGHAQDVDALTGVTVVLIPEGGAACGADVRGSAPGTRETDIMRQAKTVERVNAVMLAGGSAFGLAAADGVMAYCERQRMGMETEDAVVPIVPAAVIYDLGYGSNAVRPNAEMGYAACLNASRQVQQGSIGAGIGATVGKVLGMGNCQKGGIGTASIRLANDVTVGALICVNAFGDIIEGGEIIAGANDNGTYINSEEYMMYGKDDVSIFRNTNTTIGVVATDAAFSKDEITKVAQISHDGLARAINPVHTMMDGDTVFALSYGKEKCDLGMVSVAAAEATRRAVVNAILAIKQKDSWAW